MRTLAVILLAWCLSAPALAQQVGGSNDACCLMKQKTTQGEGKDKKEVYLLFSNFTPARDCQPGKDADGRTICGSNPDKEECSALAQEKICQKCGLTWNKDDGSCGQQSTAQKKSDRGDKTAAAKQEGTGASPEGAASPEAGATATPTPTPSATFTPYTTYESVKAKPTPTPTATPIQGSRRGY